MGKSSTYFTLGSRRVWLRTFYVTKYYLIRLSFALGQELNPSTVYSILDHCGIKNLDWKKIGKCLGLESHILSTVFFEKWLAHAHDCQPSWKKLAWALKKLWHYKHAAPAAEERAGM